MAFGIFTAAALQLQALALQGVAVDAKEVHRRAAERASASNRDRVAGFRVRKCKR